MFVRQKVFNTVMIFLFSAFLLTVVVSGVCKAADYTWTGSAGDQDWFTPGNWDLSLNFPGFASSADMATIPGGLGPDEYPILPSPISLGILTIQSGATMTINGAELSVDILNAEISGLLQLTSGVLSSGQCTIRNGGSIVMSGDDMTSLIPGSNCTIDSGGTLQVNGGTVSIGGNAGLINNGTVRFSGGDLTLNTGSLTNNNTLEVDGSTVWLSEEGELVNNAAFQLVSGSMLVSSTGNFINKGTTDWAGGTISAEPSDGVFTMNNEGSIRVRNGSAEKKLVNCNFTNASGGTVHMLSGEGTPLLIIQNSLASPQFINKGTVSGTGTFEFQPTTQTFLNDGDGSSKGVISPDSGEDPSQPYGTLEITGAFSQTSNGKFDVDIANDNFDAVLISGSATLDGELNVRTTAAGAPFSDTYKIMAYASLTGFFATETYPSIPNYQFDLDVSDPTFILLTVTSTAPATRTWTGEQDTVWTNFDNWDTGIPEDGDTVIVPSQVPNFPVCSETNTFDLVVVQGTLTIDTEAEMTASEFRIEGGQVINNGKLTWGAAVTGARQNSGHLISNGGELVNNGEMHWVNGDILLSSGRLTTAGDLYIGDSAISGDASVLSTLNISGSGEFTISPLLNMNGTAKEPFVNLSAHLSIGSEASFILEGSASDDLSSNLEGPGNITAGGAVQWLGGTLTGNPEASGTSARPQIFLNGSVEISSDAFKKLLGRDMVVNGTLSLRDGEFFLGDGAVFTIEAAGTVLVENSPLNGMYVSDYDGTGSQFINEGIIKGTGKLAFIPFSEGSGGSPLFYDRGVIAPGLSPGQLIIETDQFDHSNAVFEADIVSSSGETAYDQLIIGSSSSDVSPIVTLSGTLKISQSGYIPQEGDLFQIMVFDPPLEAPPAPEFSAVFLDGSEADFDTFFEILYETDGVFLKPRVTGVSLTVLIDPTGGGSVTVQNISSEESFTCPDICAKSSPPGTTLKLTAVPSANHEFVRWEGADSINPEKPTEAFADMTTDKTVTAIFQRIQPSETDRDGDGTPDASDGCPDDPDKTEPGLCGCGISDSDTDEDGTPDCKDGCPQDPLKTEEGVCGCGVPDTDTDEDGTPDCKDGCPEDPLKTEEGICGCGTPDTDTDKDGTADCKDQCPDDPAKTEPGLCGCGVTDTDSDQDGMPDCKDGCPNDPAKTDPGICGCGQSDADSDGDGTADCKDGCPADSQKTEPGICGCGQSDTPDRDGDGTADCLDKCPDDPDKTDPGDCGCGLPDTDCEPDATTEAVPLSPENGAIFRETTVVLQARFFIAGGGNPPIETHWWWRPADKRCKVFHEQTISYRGIAEFTVSDLRSGLQYVWRVEIIDPDTGERLSSEEKFFTIGISEIDTSVRIDAGVGLSDYQMASFFVWPEDPDAVSVLGDDLGQEYDTKFFKIGTYDTATGSYVEYDSGDLQILPGKAYWFLARDGLDVTVRGVPVSLEEDINVHLRKGWNMIAPPNKADYRWQDLKLIAYAETSSGVFEPESGFDSAQPLTDQETDNPYIDPELWTWDNGEYIPLSFSDEGAILFHNKGYWVKARRGNICLVFPSGAQQNLSEDETGILAKMIREGGAWARQNLTPPPAVADSGSEDTPPMPMSALNSGDGSADLSSRVDSGGGGCFIGTAGH